MTPAALLRLREKLGVTYAGLARLLCTSPITITRWEAGEPATRTPSGLQLVLLRRLEATAAADLAGSIAAVALAEVDVGAAVAALYRLPPKPA